MIVLNITILFYHPSKLGKIMSNVFKILIFISLNLIFTGVYSQVFVVTSINDKPDTNIGDGFCDANVTRSGVMECTLRAAIQESNMASMPATIEFNIQSGCVDDVCTITIDRVMFGNLPDIINTVSIDGSTQPGNFAVCTSQIELRPKYGIVVQGDGVDIGLRLEDGSDNSVIKGLNVRNFFNNIAIVRSNNNQVQCNYIGTDETGRFSSGNNPANGVIVICDSSNNIIGGENLADGNLISAQQSDGVQFFSGVDCGANGNSPFNNAVLGNYIGTNNIANSELENEFSGISFFGNGAIVDNFIGVLQDGITINGNIIGGNDSGIYIDDETSGTLIYGNYIGTNRQGVANLGNDFGGVDIISGSNNIVGGINLEQQNVIANNSEGVFVSGGPTTENNQIRGNSFYNNASQSIDIIENGGINPDGLNINDTDDADIGTNKLMNHPDMVSVILNTNTVPDSVDVEFMIDATIVNATYPLTIDAYFSQNSENAQGRFYLGSVQYLVPQSLVTENFLLPMGMSDGNLLLTTTDNENNTSEMSIMAITNPDLIFKNGFD